MDCQVRVWSVDGGREPEPEPELCLQTDGARLERVAFHPAADCLLAGAFGTTVRLWDILHQRQLYCEYRHCPDAAACRPSLTYAFYITLFQSP